MPQNREQDLEAPEKRRGKEGAAADADVERAWWERVGSAAFVLGRGVRVGRGGGTPSRASSKQCAVSRWEVKIVTRWPSSWRPTAASMMRRSAPPMPRSGWKNTMLLRSVIVRIVDERGAGRTGKNFEVLLGADGGPE